ncbi:slowpoke-binding protein isoform X3 [Maniola jurtina]|uniref:slowpoke-binding protein isoform X2 n=1 Tax=Maniola jurtina TaxID=191418 RepID=UPI001E68DE6D|nr:slowpoke-binding protein isoform X2 [Maniola jurtina]XP_045774986.1 slowpoke-binding protein isoform X3 [Maniola jurtina]
MISLKMFNLYQHIKSVDKEQQKEPETTGHDRFYQERSRSSYRKKKRRGACRRAQSAAELDPESVAAANKRDAFRIRSVSTDKEESEEEEKNTERTPLVSAKIDSLAKLLFNKSLMGSGFGKSSPSESAASPKQGERSMESSVALAICNEYLTHTPRYHMLAPLNKIGARGSKKWFAIHDNSIKADRLLILMPLSSQCPIEPNETSRGLIMELFRALHHPYIYPVLDVELCSGHALAVLPYSSRGSLKDLIYKSTWSEDYSRKYSSIGTGLPATQVARIGRQMLEGLLFLKEKGFPPFRHLHTGNVMVQNGVARICGLENTLIGATPRSNARSLSAERAETLLFGHVLFEMCAGADTDLTLLPELCNNYPQVVEIIELIFSTRPPTLHELVLCELFRKIDLREMKGSCLPNFSQRLSGSCLSLLNEVARRQPGVRGDSTPPRRAPADPATPNTPPTRRRYVLEQDYTEEWAYQW